MRRRLALAASLVLLVVAGISSALAIAEFYAEEVEIIFDDWSFGEEVPSDWSWEEAQRFLWLANRLDPLNPRIYSSLGGLYEVRARNLGALDREATAALERALKYYRRAAELRPAWPYAWTAIAVVKLRHKQLDAEFALALERATSLGPWEPGVQIQIATHGLSAWDELPDNQREIVRLTVERGVQRDLKPIVALAQQHFGESTSDNAQ